MHSFLSTIKHLGKIRLHMIFTVSVNSLKKFFEQTKNIKIHNAKFEVGCSCKNCNQFVLLKNFRLWH